MEKNILKFIKNHPRCSLAELESNIAGFKGEHIFGNLTSNIVFWPRMSKEAIDAIAKLVRENKVDIEEVTARIYAIDSDILVNLPIGRNSKNYKRPHWVPLVFTVV